MPSREQLLHLLAEAAELEHNILCTYLYALFSLKQDESQGLTRAELVAVDGWRQALLGLCIEEMVHLAQVSNLLVAVGARPHFNRPNFPVPPGYHPAGIVLKLAPFDLEALDHFIFLERPEEAPLQDASRFAGAAGSAMPRPEAPLPTLMPRAPGYQTIGEFYVKLRESLEAAVSGAGESVVFCGPVSHQVRPQELKAPELVVVTDLASARQAIDFVVRQGEGSPGQSDESHFSKFQTIRAQYVELRQARPAFVPHRAVATNPVMHPPVDEDRVHITSSQAAPVVDAANAVYNAMLRCLTHLYEVPWSRQSERGALLGAAVGAMKVLSQLSIALADLPARDEDRQVNAGVTFATLRATEGLLGRAAIDALARRLNEIREHIPTLRLQPLLAGSIATTLESWSLALLGSSPGASEPADAPHAPVEPMDAPTV